MLMNTCFTIILVFAIIILFFIVYTLNYRLKPLPLEIARNAFGSLLA